MTESKISPTVFPDLAERRGIRGFGARGFENLAENPRISHGVAARHHAGAIRLPHDFERPARRPYVAVAITGTGDILRRGLF